MMASKSGFAKHLEDAVKRARYGGMRVGDAQVRVQRRGMEAFRGEIGVPEDLETIRLVASEGHVDSAGRRTDSGPDQCDHGEPDPLPV